jgi:hypothetical protein
MERDGKNYWVYPHCDFEILIVDGVFSEEKKALTVFSFLNNHYILLAVSLLTYNYPCNMA